jgi:16S rRNA A1518/A1519 N6-dimethyltransferase RsmA/KsgA/DIM1 with predicted DNA glycosylase/AP lyase activity
VPSLEQARAWYDPHDPVHGFDHVLRVLELAERLGRELGADLEVLRALVMVAFGQRRKQIGSLLRRPGPWTAEALRAALAAGSVDLTLRPQAVAPVQYRDAANALAPGRGAG